MRRLTAAVFGTIGLLVAAASAWSIEGSTWFTNGTIFVDVRAAGLPRFTAEGPFESAFTGVLSNQVFFSYGQVPFLSSLTATANPDTTFFPGTPTFEPVRFTETVAKFDVDFDTEPGIIDFPAAIQSFTGNVVSNLLDVPVNFIGGTTTTSTTSSFQGIEVFVPTFKAGGQLKAFNGFSEVKGGFTISCKGLTFILDDTKPLGRKTKIRIRNVAQGIRNT